MIIFKNGYSELSVLCVISYIELYITKKKTASEVLFLFNVGLKYYKFVSHLILLLHSHRIGTFLIFLNVLFVLLILPNTFV